jgi:hypothetical protein
MKTILFAAVLAAFSFTACEKNTLDLPNLSPVQPVGTPNKLTPPENVAKWIATNYPDYVIGKTTINRKFEEVFYNVTITRNGADADKKIITFDSNGDFVSIQHE